MRGVSFRVGEATDERSLYLTKGLGRPQRHPEMSKNGKSRHGWEWSMPCTQFIKARMGLFDQLQLIINLEVGTQAHFGIERSGIKIPASHRTEGRLVPAGLYRKGMLIKTSQ